MFSEKSVGKHAFFLLIDRIEGKGGWYTLYIIYKAGGGVAGVGWIYGCCRFCRCGECCRVWLVLQELSTEIKKSFFLFLPSHPHKCGSSALFIGVSRVRAGVRAELLPSHLPSPYPHTSGRKVSCQGFHG